MTNGASGSARPPRVASTFGNAPRSPPRRLTSSAIQTTIVSSAAPEITRIDGTRCLRRARQYDATTGRLRRTPIRIKKNGRPLSSCAAAAAGPRFRTAPIVGTRSAVEAGAPGGKVVAERERSCGVPRVGQGAASKTMSPIPQRQRRRRNRCSGCGGADAASALADDDQPRRAGTGLGGRPVTRRSRRWSFSV